MTLRLSRLVRSAALAGVATLCAAAAGPGAAAATRTVLAELFGEPVCAECVPARTALQDLEAEYDDRFVWVEYSGSAPLGNADADARAAAYGVTGVPELRLDGATVPAGDPATVYPAAVDQRLAVDSPLIVGALYFFERETRLGSVAVTVQVDAGAVIPDPASTVIRPLILEDPAEWCCGTGGTSLWPKTVRAVLPPTPLTAGPGQTQVYEQEFALGADWNVDHLAGAVLVQEGGAGPVLAAARGRVSGVLQPLPVSTYDATRVTLLPAFPNPTGGAHTRIDFFLPQPGGARLRVLDVRGRLVRTLADGLLPSGYHPQIWDGRDSEGREVGSGTYVIRLETFTDIESGLVTVVR